MLFGGAFDPPHNGHLLIAQKITEEKIADQVWFIPCATHPFGKKMTPADDRLAMLRLAGTLTINTHELDSPTISYTVDTIEYFAKSLPDDTFSWLIGSDQLPTFTKWHRWQALIHNFTIYVYPRQGYSFDQVQKEMVALTHLPTIALSSTMIREQVHQKLPITDLVPPNVAQYIAMKKLYVD